MILSVEKQIYDTAQKPNKTSYQTAIEALQDAANAQDTADGKRRVFVTTPYPPYDVGDLWTDGTDLYVCSTARQDGSFASGDWTLATAYVTQTVLESEMDTAVQKVTGNLGGYVILHDTNDDGYPDELLIMDTDDITTATNVWRWNQSGLMHASSYTGTYANAAITMDGQIVADAITTGTLRGIHIISDNGAGDTIDIVDGVITTKGDYNATTRTTSYSYSVYPPSSNSPIAFMSLAAESSGGVIYPVSQGRIYVGSAIGSRKAAMIAGQVSAYVDSGANAYLNAASNGSLLSLSNENQVVEVRIDTNTTDGGGEIDLRRSDGTRYFFIGKIYHGQWTDRGLTFYDENNSQTSWYASTRAYINDTTSGEEGYVVHGHTGNHGFAIDYTTSGQIDFYVDATYIGYATIASSDERTKTDIRPIEEKYKRAVMSVDLKNFRFDFKDELRSGANDSVRFGAIAQDLIKALEAEGLDYKASELVDTVGDEERYVINYVPFLTARLAADEDRIKTLEERIAKLEKLLEEK